MDSVAEASRSCGAGPRIPVSWRNCATTRCVGGRPSARDHAVRRTGRRDSQPTKRKCMTDRPHMLYVAWGFRPAVGGGVYRALATANRLAALRWKVTVLTADRETFHRFTGADLTLEERVDPSVEVVRVPFEWPILEADLRKWSKRRAPNPKLWSKWRTKQDQIPFPETGTGRGAHHREGRRPDPREAHKVDLTVATAKPERRLHRGVPAAQEVQRAVRDGLPATRSCWTCFTVTGCTSRTAAQPAGEEAGRVRARDVVRERPDPGLAREALPGPRRQDATVANGFDPDLVPDTHDRGPAGTGR